MSKAETVDVLHGDTIYLEKWEDGEYSLCIYDSEYSSLHTVELNQFQINHLIQSLQALSKEDDNDHCYS